MLLVITYWLLLAASCWYVGTRGTLEQRTIVSVIAIGSLLSAAASTTLAQRFAATEWGIFAVDVLVLVAFVVVALRSNGFWPLWIGAFQFVAVAIHLATLVQPAVVPRAYALGQGFWAYPMLLLLVWETRREVRRREGAARS